MLSIATIVGALSLTIWLYLTFARGFFWQISRSSVVSPSETDCNLRVAAVIPARDEATVIGGVVAALLRQQGVRMPVFLVDDGSTDGTADVARATAATLGKHEQLTVIESQPLPSGWTGKLWAMREGTAIASAKNPDYLLLTDADIVHAR